MVVGVVVVVVVVAVPVVAVPEVVVAAAAAVAVAAAQQESLLAQIWLHIPVPTVPDIHCVPIKMSTFFL